MRRRQPMRVTYSHPKVAPVTVEQVDPRVMAAAQEARRTGERILIVSPGVVYLGTERKVWMQP